MAIYRNGKWTYTENDRAFLTTAVKELSDYEFRVIRMRLIELYSIEEIARVLRRSWDDIDRTIERSIKKLRSAFDRLKATRKLAAGKTKEASEQSTRLYSADQLNTELKVRRDPAAFEYV